MTNDVFACLSRLCRRSLFFFLVSGFAISFPLHKVDLSTKALHLTNSGAAVCCSAPGIQGLCSRYWRCDCTNAVHRSRGCISVAFVGVAAMADCSAILRNPERISNDPLTSFCNRRPHDLFLGSTVIQPVENAVVFQVLSQDSRLVVPVQESLVFLVTVAKLLVEGRLRVRARFLARKRSVLKDSTYVEQPSQHQARDS